MFRATSPLALERLSSRVVYLHCIAGYASDSCEATSEGLKDSIVGEGTRDGCNMALTRLSPFRPLLPNASRDVGKWGVRATREPGGASCC